jgi:hypothetical protein
MLRVYDIIDTRQMSTNKTPDIGPGILPLAKSCGRRWKLRLRLGLLVREPRFQDGINRFLEGLFDLEKSLTVGG